MRLKEVFYLLGFRPKPKVFGCEIHTFDLPREGQISYAQWLHSSEGKKHFTQEAIDELRTFLEPGDVGIDIGAHTGDTAIPMALAVGRSGGVLALEPNRYVFPVLEKNAQLNRGKTNIIPLMFAATRTSGKYEFEYSDPGFCNGGLHEGISRWRHGHAFKLEVEGRNLQSLIEEEYQSLASRIRYIKIDTEGYDFAVLQSISGLIEQTRPFIKAEVFKNTNSEQRQELYNEVTSHGYEVYRVESDSNYRGEPVGKDDLTRWRHFDIFCIPVE